MTSVDNRVVSIEFDNANFEHGISNTLKSLADLDNALQLQNASKGFDGIDKAANAVDLGHISSAVDNISSKFSILGAVAFSVLQRITDSAITAGHGIADAMITPILQGGKARSIAIENAKFQFRGLGLDVDKTMADAKAAVLGTAYGLDEAASAAARFGASGIMGGDQMQQALRGVAGTAAMTNSSFSDIADIFTAMASYGKVSLTELDRLSIRGLNVEAVLGKSLGKTQAQVRDMATKGQISFAQFSKAMDDAFGKHAQDANQTFTGSLANMHAALSRLGEAFQTPRLAAEHSVLNVLTPQIDNFKKALGPVIDLWTLFTTIKADNLVHALFALDFNKFRVGVQLFTAGIENLWRLLKRITDPIKLAFRSIFPPTMGSALLTLSLRFAAFTNKLKIGGDTVKKIARIFLGFFSMFKIGWTVLKDVVKVFGLLFHSASSAIGGGGGILGFLAKLGDSINNLRKRLVDGHGIDEFFLKLVDAIRHPMRFIDELRDKILDFFHRFTSGVPAIKGVETTFGRIGQRLHGLGTIFHDLGVAWDWVKNKIAGSADVFTQIWNVISGFFGKLGHNIAGVLKKGDFNTVLDALNIGLLGGITVLLTKWLKNGFNFNPSRGFLGNINKAFRNLTSTLQAMQTDLKAGALRKIAEAIAILTISIIALSLIDSAKLTKAMVAVAAGMGLLVGALKLLNQLGGNGRDAARLDALAGSMVIMAVAVDLLAIAVHSLSKLSWTGLAKGLLAVTLLMAGMVGALKLLGDTKGTLRASIAMISMAFAIDILAVAVKLFAKMSWSELARGLAGVAVSLAIVIGALKLMDFTKTKLGAVALLAVAVALNVLFLAVKLFSTLSWGEMLKGMVGLGAALGIVVLGLNLLDASLPGALSLLGAAIALGIVADVVKRLGKLDLWTLAKGLGALSGMMLLLVIGLNLLDAALPGALALIVAAEAITVLAGALKTVGKMKISEIITSILGLAAAIIIIGVVSAVLGIVSPLILAFGLALLVVGLGMAAFGLGASLVAAAFEKMAKAGDKGSKALLKAIETVVGALPQIISAVILGFVQAQNQLLKAVPVFVRILTAILSTLLDSLITLMPKVLIIFDLLIQGLIKIARDNIPNFIAMGFEILMALLHGLDQHMDEIVSTVASIIEQFLTSLSDNMQGIIDAGVNLLVQFLNGIATDTQKIIDAATGIIDAFIMGLGTTAKQLADAGTWALVTFLNGLTSDVKKIGDAATSLITTLIFTIAGTAKDIAGAGAWALAQFLDGIANDIQMVCDAAHRVINKLVGCLGELGGDLAGAGFAVLFQFVGGILSSAPGQMFVAAASVVAKFVSGLASQGFQLVGAAFGLIGGFVGDIASAIAGLGGTLFSDAVSIGKAIVDGAVQGVKDFAGSAISTVTGFAGGLVNAAASALGINSPSKEFMKIGHSIIEGLSLGVSHDGQALASVTNLADHVTSKMQDALASVPASIAGLSELNPTIAPVLDLSQVESEAQRLAGMMAVAPIAPITSIGQAGYISHTAETTKSDGSGGEPPVTKNIKFEQNNYSPKALSTADIYKGTKSQIAMAKEELKIA